MADPILTKMANDLAKTASKNGNSYISKTTSIHKT